jgi:hypothetical protein
MLKNLITILLSIFIISGCSEKITDSEETNELFGIWKETGSFTTSTGSEGSECTYMSSNSDYYRMFFEDGRYVKVSSSVWNGSWSSTNNVVFYQQDSGSISVQKFQIINNELHLSYDLESDFTCDYYVYEKL